MLPSLIQGKVPVGLHREKLQSINYQERKPEEHIHCLIIVLQLAAHLDDEMMNMVSRVSKLWMDMGLLGPVIFVTGIDKREHPFDREANISKRMCSCEELY